MSEKGNKYVATLDIGTSTVRCIIINESGDHVGSSTKPVTLLYPQPGYVEIEPEYLWKTVLEVIRSAIKDASLEASDITCLGISTQRCTFITWDKNTGKHYHNFITWKDLRADSLVRQHNSSYMMWGLRFSAKCLYTVTRQKRYLAASDLKAMNVQIVCRLEWVLQWVPEVRRAAQLGTAVYGMLDSWLLYRLTGGKLHMTDVSCASASGLFDPFALQYVDLLLRMYHIPASMLPRVCDSAGDHFGLTAAHLLGHPVPIRCSVADQSASLFGSCCFSEGDTKVTLGTGTFLNVNTGRQPHASISGLYPLVGWRVADELVYMAEGSSSDTATLMQWLQDMGLASNPTETSKIAASVSDTDGVLFIPSFSGIQAPVNDSRAAAGFIGLKPTTRPAHLVRAVLESVALRIAQVYQLLRQETNYPCSLVRVDGGVSSNDLIMQMTADLTESKIERAESVEMSAVGAAYLAGISAGIWKDKQEVVKLRKVEVCFTPKEKNEMTEEKVKEWARALERFLHWYS
uniref:Glycerol kinase 5 n=1 Tax=Graphocephala atropunctata TaxID=36148 RepID=A0A1B6KQ55_9HEMI